MVTTFYPPMNFGGDGWFVHQLARDLTDEGHEVHVVHDVDAFRVGGGTVAEEPEKYQRIEGIHVHRLSSRVPWLSAIVTQQTGRPGLKRQRLEQLLADNFDVIHFHNISLIGGPGILQLGRAIKLWSLHEHWWVCPTHVLHRYTGELCEERACLRCCLSQGTPPQAWRLQTSWMARCLAAVDAVLAPSRFTLARHQGWLDEQRVSAPLELLPAYSAPLPESRPLPHRLPSSFFLYVGRLTQAKGIQRLLTAMAQRPQLNLVIAGAGEMEASIRAEGLPNVHLVGPVQREQLSSYYSRATALLLPSISAETFGLTVAEAMSCGTPVVSSRCGGPEDLVTAANGFLFTGEDELLAALDALSGDLALRARMGAAGRARWQERYTPASYLERYFAAIERARFRSSRPSAAPECQAGDR